MNTKTNFIAAFAAISLVSLVGCNSQQKNNATEQHTVVTTRHIPTEEEIFNLFGTYEGTLPCADCGGKEMSLTIMDDGTYTLKYQYLDSDEGEIEEIGTYSVFDDVIVETVTPSSGEKSYYKNINDNLVLCDSVGNISEGELADLYVLKKIR